MSQKIKTSVEIDGSLTASQIANATTDTDKFLVSDGGTVKYRTGAELASDLGIASGSTSKVQHQVKAGVAINKGQAVYVTSADGTNMIVGLASNASEATSSKTMGLLNATVAVNDFADVITEGLLDGLDTSTATVGNPVWLGTGGNLIYGLANKPYAPNHLVFIGIVTRVNANNGEIFVKVQNGFELDEIHDVDLKTTTKVNGHLLGYNGSLWVNKTIAEWLGYTPYNASNPAGYISSYTETDPTVPSHVKSITTTNISNWNTAYGWGNHASAGYLTSYTETDTLASVTGRGAITSGDIYTPNNGGIFFNGNGVYGSGIFGRNFGQDLGLNAGGLERVSIASNGAVTANVSFRSPIIYDSNDTTYYADFSSTSNSLYLAGQIYTTKSTGTLISINGVDTIGYNSTTGGAYLKGTGNSYIYGGGLYFDGSVHQTLIHTGNISSYAVPTSRTITINGTSYDLSANRSWTVTASETDTLQTVTSRGATTNVRPSFDSGITVNGLSYVTANGYFVSGAQGFRWNDSSGNYNNVIMRDNGTTWFRNYLETPDSMRSPIYYDYNDTSYYGDFNSTTRQYQAISFGDSSRYSAINTTINGAGAGDKLILYGGVSNYDARLLVGADYDMLFKSQGNSAGKGSFKFYSGLNSALALTIDATQGLRAGTSYNNSPAGTYFSHTLSGVGTNRVVNFDGNGTTPSVWWTNGARAYGAIDAKDPGLNFWANNGSSWQQQMEVNYGNVTINTDIRSPIFYDSNNTGYYVDPASTSNFNVINSQGYNLLSRLDISVAAGNWYTIATNPGNRAHATFDIWDLDSGMHGEMKFVAGISFGGTGQITMLNKSWHSSGGIFDGIRIRKTGTYDTHYLQIYVSTSGTLKIAMTDNFQEGGWTLTNGGTGTPGAYTAAEVTPDSYGPGLITSGDIGIQKDAPLINFYSTSTGRSGYVGLSSGYDMRVSNASSGNLYLGSGNTVIVENNLQAAVFYDYNNTGYYLDPASTSNINSITIGSASTVYNGLSIVRSGGGSDPYGVLAVSCPSGDNYSYMGFTRNGVIGMGMGIDTSNYFWIGGSGGGHNSVRTSSWVRFGSGSTLFPGDVQATIFYDVSNTANYLDPNGTSNLYIMKTSEYRGNANVGGTGEATWHPAGIYCGSTMWQYGDMYKNNSSIYDIYNGFANSSLRAPVFYDINDTAYYADLQSSSNDAIRVRGGSYHGPNPTWGAYLLVGGDGRNGYIDNTIVASVCTTNGNLHLDAASGAGTYINFYDGSVVNFGNGSSNTVSTINNDGSHRPQTIYDYNNTGYYLDPASTSYINVLQTSGIIQGGTYVDCTNVTGGAYRVYNGSTFRGGFGTDYWAFSGGSSSDMTVYSVGNLFFASNSAKNGRLDTSGNFTVSGDVTAYGSPSDIRLKTIKEKIPNALESVLKLNGYRFDWKNPDEILNIKEDIGVIAQEVEAVFPELARTNENGFMSVRHQGLTAVLIEAIKEQQTQIEELRELVNKLINK